MPIAKMPGAIHIEFDVKHAGEKAREILRTAIEAFKKRDPARVNIPPVVNDALARVSAEAVIKILALVNPDDPLKPLIDNIVNGNILGVCLFAGCNDVKVVQDQAFVELVKNS